MHVTMRIHTYIYIYLCYICVYIYMDVCVLVANEMHKGSHKNMHISRRRWRRMGLYRDPEHRESNPVMASYIP